MRVLRLNDSGQNQPSENRFNWKIAPVLMLFHVGAVAALFFFTWSGLFTAIFLHWVMGGLGLGVCYHRLLTHRSYATPKWFEYFLTICGVTAMEGGPLFWGARRLQTRDASTNNWWVALLSFGDGWHNNHHAYPVSARHGFKWYEIDLNWYTICTFERFGLASHLHRPPRPPALVRTFA